MDERTLRILEYPKIIQELGQLAHSAPGRELCLELLPTDDLEDAMTGQAETDDAVRLILEKGLPPLHGISEIRPQVRRAISGASLSCGELLRIGAFLRAADRLRRLVPDDAPARILYDLMRRIVSLPTLSRRLDEAIAGEDEVADQASPQLASIRRRIRDAQNEVKEQLARVVRNSARALQEQLVTLRGDRYVVPVKAEYRGDIPGLVHDVSSSGATLFVEPMAVVEGNNKIRELAGLEREEIDRILAELSAAVAASGDQLLIQADLLAEIDFIIAKARLALQMKAMPPRLNREGRIVLRAARHPLIRADKVVPIDLRLGIDFHTLIITGPNTGGKTVALKTCGLLCLMAAAGLQIPARENSEVAIFDQVLADIGDEQSIEQDLSTFSAHMRNLVAITEQAGSNSLVLVDELGSGTDPSEGAALAMAILEHLRRQGCRTIATTHYRELKAYALRTDDVENACCEFDPVTLRPTFRLLIGVPGVSNAFAISRRLGLSDRIIDEATALADVEELQFEELVRSLEQSRSQADRLKDEAERLEADLKQRVAKLEEERVKLAEATRQAMRKARQEAQEEYSDALQLVERVLADLRSEEKQRSLDEKIRLAGQVRQELRSGLGQLGSKARQEALEAPGVELQPDEIILGERYEAPGLGLSGTLTDGPDAEGRYALQQGDLTVRVPGTALRRPRSSHRMTAARKSQRTSNAGSLSMDRHLHLRPEIQLLGQTVEEARINLDKFIDDSTLAGTRQIRIVHGKGTGALRSAVHQLLKQDKRVQSFRLGAYGEGDSGVTIAELA